MIDDGAITDDFQGNYTMAAYIRFILRHRLAVLAICAALTGLSVLSSSRAVVSSSLAELFLGESEEYREYSDRAGTFGSDQILLIGIDDPAFVTPAGEMKLRTAVRAVAALPFVTRVTSILDARRLGIAAGSDRENPLLEGHLVSYDGRSTAVLVELTPEAAQAAERGPTIVRDVLDRFENAGYSPENLHRAGLVVAFAEVIRQTNFSITTIFPYVAVILLLVVYLMFRRLWPALISLGVGLIGVVWTMGFAILLQRQVNILVAGVPAVILIISFSDTVHLCSAYLLELAEKADKRSAILAASEDVGRACIYTSLTTFIGFVSLSLVPTPVFRMLGLVLDFGVAIALLLAMTLVPVILSYLKPPPVPEGSRAKGLLDRALIHIARVRDPMTAAERIESFQDVLSDEEEPWPGT